MGGGHVPAAGGERGGGAHGDGVSGGDHLRVRLRSVCVRGRSDGGATWLERWKIARLWCKHVIDFILQRRYTNCTYTAFLVLKMHSLAVGKKRKIERACVEGRRKHRPGK